MENFFATYGTEVICALLVAGALFICRACFKKMKELNDLVQAQ
jgi:hypothetical protein